MDKDQNCMIPLLVIILLLLAGSLIFLLIFSFKNKKNSPVEDDIDWSGAEGKKVHSHCPLCGEPLSAAERVQSDLFPGGKDPEAPRMMHIHGCPYCYKDHPRSRLPLKNQRICPSCKSSMPAQGFCYAHFYQNRRKTHVSILGCTQCR